jgi:hypothetical protein
MNFPQNLNLPEAKYPVLLPYGDSLELMKETGTQ